MAVIIRHRRFPLERSLPVGLYYSTDPDKAKKLIHIKRVRSKLVAIRRTHLFELEHGKNIEAIRREYMETVRSIEECYSAVELPRQICLILIRTPRSVKGQYQTKD